MTHSEILSKLSHNDLTSIIDECFVDGSRNLMKSTNTHKEWDSPYLNVTLDGIDITISIKVELSQYTIDDPFFELHFNDGINQANEFKRSFESSLSYFEGQFED